MKGSGAGGFVLLLVGALGVIGYLTGQLPRWLGALFSPGVPVATSGQPGNPAAGGTVYVPPPVSSSNQRNA